MGAERARRPRGPRGDRVPARAQRASSTRARPGVARGRRGVDRVAGRLAADRPRRARLRLQVEHGLDARHARSTSQRDPIHRSPPPRRADLRPALRVQRELRPAALPRRGRARQGLAPAQDAGRPLAAARQPARAVRRTCGRTRARSCCSWAASSPGARVESRRQPRLAPAATCPAHAGVQQLVRDLNRVYRDEPALWERRRRARRASRGSRPNDAAANVLAFCRFARRRRRRSCASRNLSPVPREGYRVGLPRAGRWREVLNTDAAAYGGSGVGQPRRRRRPRRRPGTASRLSARSTLPPLGVVVAGPGGAA